MRDYYKEKKVKFPWWQSYRGAKDRCKNGQYKERGIEFHLTLKQVKELWFRDNAEKMIKPSIDRIETTGHYTYDNCRFIEWLENTRRTHSNHLINGWDKYGSCVDCKTTKRKYEGKGRCSSCYKINYRKNKKCINEQ